jgi:hypothetical protein
MQSEVRVTARLPQRLLDAVAARAEAENITRSDVVRAAVAREVSRPVDRRSRLFLEQWLAGEVEADQPRPSLSTFPFPIELTTVAQPRLLAGCRADANGILHPSHVLLSDAEVTALGALSANDPRAQGLKLCTLISVEVIDGAISPVGRAALEAAITAATRKVA